MNLDGIDVFVKVVQLGSFTKAAAALGRPVTTISDKVAQLEKRLQVSLLTRTTRQLKLTSMGEIYYQKSLKAIQDFEDAERMLKQTQVEPQGVLKLTVPIDVGHTVLPALIKRYLKKHPKVSVDLMVTNRMVDLVAEGVDLAIRAGRLVDSTFKSRKFLETSGALWATPEYVKTLGKIQSPKDLQNIMFVRFKNKNNSNEIELTKGKEKLKIKVNSRVVVDDLETVKKIILQSEGVGLIPDFICEKEEKTGALVRLLPDWAWGEITLSFVYPAHRFLPAHVKAFIDLALQECAEEMVN